MNRWVDKVTEIRLSWAARTSPRSPRRGLDGRTVDREVLGLWGLGRGPPPEPAALGGGVHRPRRPREGLDGRVLRVWAVLGPPPPDLDLRPLRRGRADLWQLLFAMSSRAT